ncbi:MAG: hypothetical protein M1133_02210 [Armatimonadetes bacterium]|nr:hypothetical protein [Armatimonadota bacterium]
MIIEAREDTITLRGVIKANIWPAIQAAAALLLENHPTGIIIDCSPLTRITAKGAETLEDASRYIREKHARIVVAGLSAELLEIGKEVPAVRSQLPVCDTVEEARASLELEELTPRRGRARIAAVVPIFGDWRAALNHAEKLAVGENAEIHLVDFIKVPRTLPIGTPLHERETEGQRRLEEAKALAKDFGVKTFAHVERVRSESAGIVEFVSQLRANFSVVSIDRGERTDPHIEQSEAMSLLEAAEFEVSLVKGAAPGHAAPSVNAVVPAVGAWDHAVEHACRLMQGQNAVLNVVSLIVVPRSEPIDTPKPDAEAAASDAAKESTRIGKRYSVKVNPMVERVRDPILGFMKMFNGHAFDLAVVGVERITVGDYHIAQAVALALLQESPCETVFLRTEL